MPIGVSATILPKTQEEAIKAVEVLSRAVAGLAFEGISVSININPYDPDEDN